jgi:hypothetical protein
VATIFERETLGQRWSNSIFYSTLLNQGVFISESRLEEAPWSGAATMNKSKNELEGHHFTVGVIETLRLKIVSSRPM